MGSIPNWPTKWTRSLKPEWRGSGLLIRGPVDRNHSRPLLHLWTSYRSGRTGRTLNPLTMPIAGSNPAWSPMCLYPNRQRERVESAFSARSSRARHTRFRRSRRLCLISHARSFCAVMHRVRQLDCLSSETGSSPVQRAISSECSAAWKCSSSGTKRSLVRIRPLRPITASALACGSVL